MDGDIFVVPNLGLKSENERHGDCQAEAQRDVKRGGRDGREEGKDKTHIITVGVLVKVLHVPAPVSIMLGVVCWKGTCRGCHYRQDMTLVLRYFLKIFQVEVIAERTKSKIIRILVTVSVKWRL